MTFREAKIYFEKFPEIHEKTHVLVSHKILTPFKNNSRVVIE